MASSPNKLSQFWQELKRRKVVSVVTVYAATAFVILELVDIIAPNLGLPSWTFNLILILICVGFVITVIVSWIYDIQSEGGIVKTEPAHKAKPEDIPKSSNSWKIASYISFVVIVALIVLNIVPRADRAVEVDLLNKSIAVLPFHNDSPDQDNEYFINGTMESILNNLCKIKDLRVISRSSVEQYRDTITFIPEVAEKLEVSYVLEGSMQKYGNHIRMSLQLIDKNDKHIWAAQYDRQINSVEDHLSLQSEIAQLVAEELQVAITPEEKQLIEKNPTTNLTAYDFYQRGREEFDKYWTTNDTREALERAKDLFQKALEYDSAFALAYTGLAWIYRSKYYWNEVLTENFLDSILILADIALSIDDQLSEAYLTKGDYYRYNNDKEQALKEYDKAIQFNPNDWNAYYGIGRLNDNADLVKSIDNYHKAGSLERGPFLPFILRLISEAYYDAGFIEKWKYYSQEALKLDFDSVKYYLDLAVSENNREKSIEFLKKGFAIDSNNTQILNNLGENHMFLGQHEEALKYFKRKYEINEALGISGYLSFDRIGYLYWQIGYTEEAEYYFNNAINYYSRVIDLGRGKFEGDFIHYTLAGVYAVRGEKDKAYENLRIFNQRQIMPYWMTLNIKDVPLFDSIRDEQEFQQIIDDVEAKYQSEHERVRQWLMENDLL